MHAFSNMDLLPKADLPIATAECSICQQQRSTKLLIWSLDHFNQIKKKKRERKTSTQSSLKQILALDIDLSSLLTMLLRKPPSVNLQDVLFTIMVFCPEALLLISELILQQMKHNNKFILVEFTDLTIFSIVLKLLGDRKQNGFLKIQNRTSWLATPCRAGARSFRMLYMITIWCCFTQSQDSQVQKSRGRNGRNGSSSLLLQ